MKKYFFIAAAMLLAATSCTNESVETEVKNNAEQVTAPVTVRVNDFSITTEDMPSGGGVTRAAQNVTNYNAVKAIDLAFYSGETEVYKHTQLRTDNTTYTTFGNFSCNLPVGTYTMVAIARGNFTGDEFTLTSPTAAGYTSERVRETFCATQSVTVTLTGANVSVTLNRVMAKLQVLSTDNRPAGVSKIRTTYAAGGKSFNPTTGLATVNNGFSLTNTPSAAVGSAIRVESFLFLATDEQTMNITLEVLDTDENVLFTRVVPNVPMKRNRCTILRGALFAVEPSAASFQVETAWQTDHTVNF